MEQGFIMSKFPTKENEYIFKSIGKTNEGDRVAAESSAKAINFVYAAKYNTTIIYNSSKIIKAYEGKYKKN
ncbi:hypothetical protein [Chryseobacterium oleae]|uniref:hypothetical protein n=1 Tax=Chryseobacterium oleae TaxID=491207 RepID=UPI00142E45E2|nr:hypothetical protein [Chryseobacterium oleae]